MFYYSGEMYWNPVSTLASASDWTIDDTRKASVEAGPCTTHEADPCLMEPRESSGMRADARNASSGADDITKPVKINFQLNAMLLRARTMETVLRILDQKFGRCNAVNQITALHRLATMCSKEQKVKVRQDTRFKRFLCQFGDMLAHTADPLKPRDVSNAAWALAKLGVRTKSYYKRLNHEILCTVRDFEPVNISMVLWAFVHVGFIDEKLFRALACEAKLKVPAFESRQIAMVAAATAMSGFEDEELFLALADAAIENISDTLPVDCANLVHAFSVAEIKHPALFQAVAQRCTLTELLRTRAGSFVITTLAAVYSADDAMNKDVLDTVGTAAVKILDKCEAKDIVNVVKSCALARIRHDCLISQVSKAVQSRQEEFNRTDRQELVWAYQSLGYPTDEITRDIPVQRAEKTLACDKLRWNAIVVTALLYFLIVWGVRLSGVIEF